MTARTSTILIADGSAWPERLGQDLRFGYQLAPTTFSIDETVGYLESAQQHEREVGPDLVVADADLVGGGAVELCRRLNNSVVDVAVLVATFNHGREDVLDAVAEGASGYLVRTNDIEATRMAIAKAIIGEPVVNPPLAGLILSHFRSFHGQTEDSEHALDSQERRIVQLVARNHGTAELADFVQMSVAEVEQAMRIIFDKLRASRQALLADC